MRQRTRVVVLVSGSGSNLQAIIDACAGTMADDAEIVAVISNVPEAFALERARQHDIPGIVVNHKAYPSREDFDQALADAIRPLQADLIVLAGFMRILSAPFVKEFLGKLINIHPSLLPKYPGLNTHKRALDNNDKHHGCSIHFVTQELDGGPIVAQSSFSTAGYTDELSLKKRVQKLEHALYPRVVAAFVQGNLALRNNRVYFEGKLVDGIPLSITSEH